MVTLINNTYRTPSRYLAILTCFFLLSCGGGGSSESTPANQTQIGIIEPPVNVGFDESTITQVIDGQLVDRSFLIKYPDNQTKDKYPVVFFFHGSGGNAQSWLDSGSEVTDLIDAENFIGIFPNGYESAWNVSSETEADDVEFISLIVNELTAIDLFDFNKVYGIGISNGAGIVNRIAKETTIFTAIAPLISQQTISVGETVPTAAMSVFQLNGDNDELVPLAGGNGVAGNLFMSAKESAENWASNANCNMTPLEEAIQWGDKNLVQFTFEGCINNHRVRYLIAQDSGHSVNFGESVDLINIIWEFFSTIDNSPAQNIKLLALGDSYTIGQSVCTTCNFPQQLKQSLAAEYTANDTFDLQIIAQTGWTTTDLKNAIATENPASDFDLVTLLIGVNNQVRNKPMSLYESEFAELVDSAISFAGGDASRLILMSIPDYTYTPYGRSFDSGNASSELLEYNNFAQQYGVTNGLAYVYITDITQNGLDNPDLVASDGLHPSDLAYSYFVERILPVALEALEHD